MIFIEYFNNKLEIDNQDYKWNLYKYDDNFL